MGRALNLISKVVTLRFSPALLIYALRGKLDGWLGNGNRRYEFERRYLENPDPWNYRSSPYEQEKYERTLSRALEIRRPASKALEIGCSVGVFTKMLAAHFDVVTAVDISKEALAAARVYTKENDNIEYLIGDFRTISIFGKYDIIFCAEVLYYISETDAPKVVRQLRKLLKPSGAIIMVTLLNKPPQGALYFDEWERVLAPDFKVISKQKIDDDVRPYYIVTFSHGDFDVI